MGRVKLIETPERLFDIFQEYKDVISDNPKTIEGFRLFCKKKYSNIKHYFNNPEERYSNYKRVCDIITNQIQEKLLNDYKNGLISHSYVIRIDGYTKIKDQVKTKIHQDQFLFEDGLLTIDKKYFKPQLKRNLKYNNIIDGIYVLKISGSNIYKIGVTGNITRRIHDIRASNPFNIELIYFQKCLFALDLESKIHELLKYNHIKSEWFVINEIEKYLNIIKNN